MTISVIVSTYRRPKELAHCLKALQKQERVPDEILVVTRHSDEETYYFLEKVKPIYPTLYIVTVNSMGQIAALNAGLDKAKGEIISFIDDDTVPHSHWLKLIEEYFEADPGIGGVGGRDWCSFNGQMLDGTARVVGKLFWFGLMIGNHHLGGGKPREVDHLKGANMSFRRAAIGKIHFDERLRGSGSQVLNDTAFSLAVKRAGWKLVYDPKVAVDHYMARRFDEDQRVKFNPIAVENKAHNETLVFLEHFSPLQRITFVLWVLLVGNRGLPGVALCMRALVRGKREYWPMFFTTLKGRWEGWKTWKMSVGKKYAA